MATIALPRPIAPHRAPSSIGPLGSPLCLDAISSQSTSQCPVAVPNKHIPTCPPGPVPSGELSTHLPSLAGQEAENLPHSLLSPPDSYTRLYAGPYSIYTI